MDLRELGALLRAERERRGLSIEQVSDKIKITRTCLAAIEEGNEDCLPHPVYAKGFIKNYAKLLGMDNEAFREGLSGIYPAEEPPLREIPLLRDAEDAAAGAGESGLPAKGSLLPYVFAAGGLIVLLALAWLLYAKFFAKPAGEPSSTDSAATTEPAPPTTRVAPIPTVPPTSIPTPEPAKPATPAPAVSAAPPVPEPAPTAKAPIPESKPATEPTAEDRATEDIATNGGSAPTAAAGTAKQFTVGEHGNHMVIIMANDRCWLQAGADGGNMHETMLEAGDSFTGRFNDYLLVRLGNAGAVEIQFDGKVYPFHASKGSVKTLKFMGRSGEEPSGMPVGTGSGKPGHPETVTAPTPTPAPTPATPAPAAPTPAPTTPAPATPAPAGKPGPVAATPADKPAGAGETAATGGKELEVYGQDGSWVILMPDKGPAKEVYVKKGQRMTVPFEGKIEVKLGNPSNVVFRYDGKETPVTTERGEARTIRFPPQ